MPRSVRIVAPSGDVTSESLARLIDEINKRFEDIGEVLPNVSQTDFSEISKLSQDVSSESSKSLKKPPKIIQAPADSTALKNDLEQVMFPAIQESLEMLQSKIVSLEKSVQLVLKVIGK